MRLRKAAHPYSILHCEHSLYLPVTSHLSALLVQELLLNKIIELENVYFLLKAK